MNDATEVKLHFLDYWRIIRARAGLITLTFLLVLITAGVTTYFLPREYFSKVSMEVKPDKQVIDVFNSQRGAGADPLFLPTQFQALQKTEILYPVIDRLKLLDTWSTEGRKLALQTVYLKLRKMMDLREVRNTTFVDIGIYSTDPQEAANIANTIAVVYQEKRLSDVERSIDKSLAQLREELEKQRKQVEEAAVEMTRIRDRDAIIDPDPENFSSVLNTADRNIVALEVQLNEQRLIVTRIKGELEQILKLQPEQLKDALRILNSEDPTVLKMVASLQEANSEEARLTNAGLGQNHPKILGLRAQREVFSKQLSDQLSSIRVNHATKLEIAQRTLSELESKFTTSQTAHIDDKKKMGSYSDAKSRYLQAKKIYEAAQIKYSTEHLSRGLEVEPVKIWEKAEPSLYPAKPNVPAYMALAAIVGLVLGVGLAFFIEYLDTSVKTLDDVEKYLNIPVLAVIPKDVQTLLKSRGDSPHAEAYRILRANVEFNKPDRNANTFTLVSGGPGEGKSTTLNNLAFTCAQGGYNVLVVDADLRRPTQHTFFDQENSVGLTDYLTGKLEIDEITKTTKIDNLSFIPSGELPEDAVGILNSQRMVDLITKVKHQYDLVFFDAPPILGVSDGSVLASECDITIMVVQHRRFPRGMLLRVKQAVAHAGGTLIGVVLNNVDTTHDDGSGYYSYSEYYAPRKAEPVRREPVAPVPAGAAVAPARPRVEPGDY